MAFNPDDMSKASHVAPTKPIETVEKTVYEDEGYKKFEKLNDEIVALSLDTKRLREKIQNLESKLRQEFYSDEGVYGGGMGIIEIKTLGEEAKTLMEEYKAKMEKFVSKCIEYSEMGTSERAKKTN